MQVHNGASADPSVEKTDVIILKRHAQRAIWLASIILPALFTYLSFKDVPLRDVLTSLSEQSAASLLWKLVLAVYFLAWVVGTSTDAEDQEFVYRQVPERGRLSNSSIVVIAAILLLAAILLWSPTFEFFVAALTAFFILNIVAWAFLVRHIVLPSVRSSLELSQNARDFVGGEQIRVVAEYLCGRWQLYRFALGGVVILGLWAILLAKQKDIAVPGIPEPISWELCQVLGMLVFVLVMETWIWGRRLRTKIALGFLNDFKNRYTFVPRNVDDRSARS